MLTPHTYSQVRQNVSDVSYHITEYHQIIAELRRKVQRLQEQLAAAREQHLGQSGAEGGWSWIGMGTGVVWNEEPLCMEWGKTIEHTTHFGLGIIKANTKFNVCYKVLACIFIL